ncbi:transcriptional regulator BetI [Breoghania sp.]|uniref:transcriptional regulator BetI n=1 Tax=Breoghania sp. TaxID=2065378 RepID=UPI0026085773|nr:transcriptional regulator BetI [Breoghania sp.]MDJ0932945.1 transcriptional regulator BetI [Breoghania sp.]
MPRIGMEGARKRALISATVETIHECGFCDATVADIARRAGVSGGLALHYFGSKKSLLTETMRHLLADLARELKEEREKAHTPRQRISAVIAASFAPSQFRAPVISAWLAFYLQAETDPETQRLLQVYHRWLISNLTHEFRTCVHRRGSAKQAAEGTAALIDGLWLQRALAKGPADARTAMRLVEDYVERQIEAEAPTTRGGPKGQR